MTVSTMTIYDADSLSWAVTVGPARIFQFIMSKAAIAGLKLMLSTGEYADVHFLVGDGDAKELVPAHKLILKHASDVFEAMFRFDANKEQSEDGKKWINTRATLENFPK
ncbi:hypothetical protein niasHT_028840 [Heterodera trifolii]|uniref:BTB domain-containing protein n=1 Tax=Heterodera trifolii TaxID=157864 RepID=A0ABD2KQJ0_9BILA